MIEEEIHGVSVQDPYRWLEESDTPETRDWISEQTTYSRSYLGSLSMRDGIRQRMAEILASGSISTPTEAGGRYFYSRRAGDQDQPVVYMRNGLDGDEQSLLDPNSMSADGTTTVDWFVPSKDGTLLAYGKSVQGTETSTMYLRDVGSGEDLNDVFPKVRFANPQWLRDGSGFYYSRPSDVDSIGPGEELYDRRVYFHEMGRDYDQDPVVYGRGPRKRRTSPTRFSATTSDTSCLTPFSAGGGTISMCVTGRPLGQSRSQMGGSSATPARFSRTRSFSTPTRTRPGIEWSPSICTGLSQSTGRRSSPRARQ